MARKTLERLTFDYLKAAMAADNASVTKNLLPIYQNQVAATRAFSRMEDARDALARALEPTPIEDYILGIYKVTAALLGAPADLADENE